MTNTGSITRNPMTFPCLYPCSIRVHPWLKIFLKLTSRFCERFLKRIKLGCSGLCHFCIATALSR